MITEEWCDAAARFPDNNPRYKVQDGTFAIGGRTVFDNPLHSSRMVHAHALGLTGAGEVIVVVDAGFRMAHEAFAGKSSTPIGNPGVDDHGTMVASIAAGSSPTMTGVAPGANLIFSDWGRDNVLDLVAAANAARNRNAVVQHNSWGFVDRPITQASHESIVGISGYAAWLAALTLYAADGVQVFAISNEEDAATAGLRPRAGA